MRLLLLPISTRRALVYCEPPSQSLPNAQQTYVDKAVNRASTIWASWEKTDKGWKFKVTQYGNKLLRRIPYEEWGLKSIPALRERRKQEYADNPAKMAVDVKFPGRYQSLVKDSVLDVLRKLGSERQGLHQKRLWYSVAAMPLTIPFGLLPVIPNLPFFYLAFRAYSHYRALTGSRHLSHLVNCDLLRPAPDPTLDSLYSAGLLYPTRADSRNAEEPSPEQTQKITALIRRQMHSEPIVPRAGSTSPTPPPSGTKKPGNRQPSGGPPKPPSGETQELPQDEQDGQEEEEIMLLKGWNGKLIAERLGLPGLEVEIERAVEQVESSLKKGDNVVKKEDELDEEKKEIETVGQTWRREKKKAS